MKSSLQVYTACSENCTGAEIIEIRLCLLPGMREAFEKSILSILQLFDHREKGFL